jgi:hypothetical protein
LKNAVFGKAKRVAERKQLSQAHQDKANEYERKGPVAAEEYRNQKHNFHKLYVNERDRDEIKSFPEGRLAVAEPGGDVKARCQNDNKKKGKPRYRKERLQAKFRAVFNPLLTENRDHHANKQMGVRIDHEYRQKRGKKHKDQNGDKRKRPLRAQRFRTDLGGRAKDIVCPGNCAARQGREKRPQLIGKSFETKAGFVGFP